MKPDRKESFDAAGACCSVAVTGLGSSADRTDPSRAAAGQLLAPRLAIVFCLLLPTGWPLLWIAQLVEALR